MKYMLLLNTPGTAPYQLSSWPTQDIKAHLEFMMDINRKLMASGEFVIAQGLAGRDQAKRVRAGEDGMPVTDGVFPPPPPPASVARR